MVHTMRIPYGDPDNMKDINENNIENQLGLNQEYGNYRMNPNYSKPAPRDQAQLDGYREFLKNAYYVDEETAVLEMNERVQSFWAERVLPFIIIGGSTVYYLFFRR